MAQKLLDVVTWKGRTQPGKRAIPRHLKLAILSRGRITLPARNVLWLIDQARARGETWPDRLDLPFEEIAPEVSVTVELFWQQLDGMNDQDVDAAIAPYLMLRHRRELRGCWHVLYGWVRHPRRRDLEIALDVDFRRLYTKPRVFPKAREQDRYIVVAYLCVPPTVVRHIQPESDVPPPPTTPPDDMPPLEGLTAPNAEFHVRVEPEESAESFGQLVGDSVWVDVLQKRQVGALTWYQVRCKSPIHVHVNGTRVDVPPLALVWIASPGFAFLVAPWSMFRAHLAAWESTLDPTSLSDRITALRQACHEADLPFDSVIGTPRGKIYKEDLVPDEQHWQMVRDYMCFRAPDGAVVELQHVLVGLDALQHRDQPCQYLSVPVGHRWAAATWAGDLGAAVADYKLANDKNWERWHRAASVAERVGHYVETRAGDWDLFGNIDAWQLDALRRAGTLDRVDLILAAYYERTLDGQLATLTVQRGNALAAFLSHYGFVYDVARDYENYPALPRQEAAVEMVATEINLFAQVWIFHRKRSLMLASDPSDKSPDASVVAAVTSLFLHWLEAAAIANGTTTT